MIRDKFERTISNGIHWNDEKNGLIDIEYYRSLNTAKNCVYASIGISALFFLLTVIKLVSYVQYGLSFGILILAISPYVLFFVSSSILGFMGCAGIKKRKPNALFQLRTFAFLTILFFIFLVIANVAVLTSWIFLIWVAVSITALIMLYAGRDLSTLYPQGYPIIKVMDYVLASIGLLGSVLLLVSLFL